MFEAATNHQVYVDLAKPKPRPVKKIAKSKVGTKVSLASVVETVNEWRPIALNPTRKELTMHLLSHLSSRGIKVKKGCIPTLLVQGKYPIEILVYSNEEDVFELLGRMLWINDEYGSVIGVLSGIEEEEYAEEIRQSCEGIFLDEKKFSLIFV
jgi:hypothetical protein